MRDTQSNPKLLHALLFLFLGLLVLLGLSALWTPFGGLDKRQLTFEIPVALLFSACLLGFAGFVNRSHRLLATATLLGPYLAHDGFFLVLDRSPRLNDLNNWIDLYRAAPSVAVAIAVLACIWLLMLCACLLISYRHSSAKRRLCLLPSLGGILLLLIGCQFGLPIDWEKRLMAERVTWDDHRNIRRYGRLTEMLATQGQAARNRQSLKERMAPQPTPSYGPLSSSAKPPVYLVVLESFTDPRLIKDLSFDRSPLHPSLSPFLLNDRFDLVRVPVYGGGTPQTEFEVLTGAPALNGYGAIEHNSLTGDHLPAFVQALKEAGYQTRATIAASPRFYNGVSAYASHSFDSPCFIDLCAGFSSPSPYKYIHDEDLLARFPSTTDTPQLNYVLGMYGHIPLERHLDVRPDVVQLTGEFAGDKTLTDLANQFYYRSKAIGELLQRLTTQQSNAIVMVLGDHLPPLYKGNTVYTKDKRQSIALLVSASKRVDIDGYKSWQLPYLIAEQITASSVPVPSNEIAQQWYHYLMRVGNGM